MTVTTHEVNCKGGCIYVRHLDREFASSFTLLQAKVLPSPRATPRRFDELGRATVQHLWNSSAGCFYNKDSGTNASIERVTPNQFYPLLAGKQGVGVG